MAGEMYVNPQYTYGPDGSLMLNPNQAMQTAPASTSTSSSYSYSGGTGGAAPVSGQQQSIWDTLYKKATQPATVDTTDPTFRAQADTFAAAQERSRRSANADNAEAMNANMLGGSGAQYAAERANNEKAAQNTGSFEAQLAGRELTAKRAEIQNALNEAASLGNSDAQRQLQWQLGQIDAQLRASGISSNENIANNQIGFDYTQLQANQNNTALRMLLGQ